MTKRNPKRSRGHTPAHFRQTGMCETLMEEDIIQHHLLFYLFFAPVSHVYNILCSIYLHVFSVAIYSFLFQWGFFHLCLLSLYPLLNAFFFFCLFEHIEYIVLVWWAIITKYHRLEGF